MIDYLADLSARLLMGLLIILGILCLCVGFAILLGKLDRLIGQLWGYVL